MTNRNALLVAVLMGLVLHATACATVRPEQRAKLAHPTMKPDDTACAAREHVYAVQEGALGGTFGASSGCGCN